MKSNKTINTAIYYHPEAYTISGPKLMGRNAAGESFIRGFLSYCSNSEFWAQIENREHGIAFAKAVTTLGRNESVRLVDRHSLAALSEPGVIYYPGPGIGQHAWYRATHGHASWSLCGITHTTSSTGAMDSLVELLTAPVQPWDAVICTSSAVKDNVNRVLQAEVDRLKERLGVQKIILPQLPVIPLGIHTDDFRFTTLQKQKARTAIDADEHTHVVLYMGRLSFHAKAHPLAMYQALQKAAQKLPKGERILLVECGWFSNEFIEQAYIDASREAAPSVKVVRLDGRKAEDRQTAWASADIFCSLSDNIQETFGIVPIEAMAAGIPVVVSDWDGYKDTVRDGIDGFRVPTLMPQAGLGNDLAYRHALGIDNYDMYCGHACSLVAVDIEAAASSFSDLFASKDLRYKIGSAGERRAKEVYDWSVIIPQYEQLWAQLAEIRLAEKDTVKLLPHAWPARMDPFHAFGSYPTTILTQETRVELVDNTVEAALARVEQYGNLKMVDYAKFVLPTDDEVKIIIGKAVLGTTNAGDLIKDIPQKRQSYVFRALVWLVKLGILRPAK